MRFFLMIDLWFLFFFWEHVSRFFSTIFKMDNLHIARYWSILYNSVLLCFGVYAVVFLSQYVFGAMCIILSSVALGIKCPYLWSVVHRRIFPRKSVPVHPFERERRLILRLGGKDECNPLVYIDARKRIIAFFASISVVPFFAAMVSVFVHPLCIAVLAFYIPAFLSERYIRACTVVSIQNPSPKQLQNCRNIAFGKLVLN